MVGCIISCIFREWKGKVLAKIGKRDKHQREPSSYDYGTGLHLNSKRLRCNLKMELRLQKFHRTPFYPLKDVKIKRRKDLENQECFRGTSKRNLK